MKNNNRNRKLKFIREKNRLRLGQSPYTCFFKLTDEYYDDVDLKDIKESILKTAKEHVKSMFKLNLSEHSFIIGLDGNDFIKNQQTIKLELIK